MKSRFDSPIVWDDLRYFLAVARAGTLSEASRRLGVSVATVSRRLERLEEALGLRLFHRHAQGLRLTEQAEGLLERAQGVMEGVFSFLRAAEGEESSLQGEVRLSTVETIVDVLLAPRLATFRERYPGIRLSIRADPRVIPLSTRMADVALRVARPTEERVVCQRVASLDYGLYASQAYLDRRGRPARPEQDLQGVELISYDERWDGLPESRWLLERATSDDIKLRLNTVSAVLRAVEHGAGVGILPRMIASPALICLCQDDSLPTRDIWLAVHEDLRDVPRVRAVLDFLRDCVEEAI